MDARHIAYRQLLPDSLTGRRGFTLLEVMVAMAILAICMTTIISSQSRALSVVEENDFARVSAILANATMAELMHREEGGATAGKFAEPYSGYSWRARFSRAAVTEIDALRMPPGLEKITLRISDDRRGRHFEVRRYRFEPGAR